MALIDRMPKGVTLFFKSFPTGLKTLPCQQNKRASGAATFPNHVGLTMAVPCVSPAGISPTGLFAYSSSSSACDRLNKSCALATVRSVAALTLIFTSHSSLDDRRMNRSVTAEPSGSGFKRAGTLTEGFAERVCVDVRPAGSPAGGLIPSGRRNDTCGRVPCQTNSCLSATPLESVVGQRVERREGLAVAVGREEERAQGVCNTCKSSGESTLMSIQSGRNR